MILIVIGLIFNIIPHLASILTRYISNKFVLRPDAFDEIIYDKWKNHKNVISEAIKTSDGETLDAFFYNKNKKPSYNEDLIYFYHHGNSGWIGLVLETNTCDCLANYGSIFLYDYRGYGKSTGSPTDSGLFIDSLSAWNFLVNERHVNPNKIIMFGHSLGSSVMANLTRHLLEKGELINNIIILQNPFTSINRICKEISPLFGGLVMLDFNTDNAIKKIDNLTSNLKIFIIHSNDDKMIDKSHSFDLAKHIKSNEKRVIIVPGTHDDIEYGKEIRELLQSLTK